MREKRHIKAKVQHVLYRLDVPPVNVDGIAHRLESEEGNAYWQQDFFPNEIRPHDLIHLPRKVVVHLHLNACDLREEVSEEIGVFEVDENE